MWVSASIFIIMIMIILILILIRRSEMAIIQESLKQLNSQLKRQALYDHLTEIPTRVLLLDRLNHFLSYSDRNNSQCFVLFIDLDGFKNINDKFVHRAGDDALIIIADRLTSILRPSDTVCRWGGDEFVAFMPNCKEEDVIDVINRILAIISQKILLEDYEFNLTASIGIASNRNNDLNANDLIKLADEGMYIAKTNGKNQYFFVKE